MNSSNGSGYLSPAKLIILLCIEQYSRHYEWGPNTLSDLGEFLINQLYEPTWTDTSKWTDLRSSLQKITTPLVNGNSGGEDSTLLSVICEKLSELQTLDSLHSIFDRVRRLPVDAGEDRLAAAAVERREEANGEDMLLDSESILGIFIRRCTLAFDQMEFHQTTQFFAECQRMVLVFCPGHHNHHNHHQQQQQQCRIVCSLMEMQEHVESLVTLLEQEVCAPVPETMQKEIKQALELLPDYSRIHYLQYLDLIRMGESHESEQSLRRFFDNNTIKDNHTIYQYALLHLAAMRAQLGMAGAAREALVEATHVARDCQDHLCLLYILCWESRLLLQGALKNEAGGSDNRGGDGDGEADAIRAHRSISMLIDKARAMENHEMRAVGHIMLVDLLLLLSNDADFSEIFSNLVRVRALIVEHDLTKLHASWYLTASRVFMHNESGAWLSLLHAQLAGAAGQTSLTERENSEFMRQLARTQAVLCGPLHAAQYMVGQLSQAKFINPTRMDALADQLRWLQVDDNTKDYHSHEGACDGSDSGSGDGGARRLSEARSLAEDGYICEARELLIEIACCGEARIPSDLRYRRSLYEPIAVRKAIQLLSSLE